MIHKLITLNDWLIFLQPVARWRLIITLGRVDVVLDDEGLAAFNLLDLRLCIPANVAAVSHRLPWWLRSKLTRWSFARTRVIDKLHTTPRFCWHHWREISGTWISYYEAYTIEKCDKCFRQRVGYPTHD